MSINNNMDDKFELSEQDLKDLLDEVSKITTRNKEAQAKEHAKKLDLDTALGCTLKEFLSSFVLIGYDLSGDKVIIRSEDTPMQEDALKSFLLSYIQLIMYEG